MAKQVAKAKVKKKKWFPVTAPKPFREQVVGEIHLYESQAMMNRILTVNMMNLTGNPRNQHINVILRINQVNEGKGHTEVLGYEMMPSSVKRIVRRGRTKVSDSMIVSTSDNKKVKIKPLVITNTNVNKSVANSIRILLRNIMIDFVKKITFDQLVEEIMSLKLQKYLGNNAAKIAPVRNSDIRGFRLIEKEGVGAIKPAKMKKAVRVKEEERRPVPPPRKEEEKKPEAKKEAKPKEEVKVEEKKAEEPKKEEVKKKEAKEEKSLSGEAL